jgi:hypothetical protein
MSVFMKGLYVIWPDEDYIDKCVESGIDTLILSITLNEDESNITRLCKKYKDMGVTIVPSIAYDQYNYNIPLEDQFSLNGRRLKHCACPTSRNYINTILDFPVRLFKKGYADAVGIDFEDYSVNIYPNDSLKYHGSYESNNMICGCSRCKNLTEYEQRRINSENIRNKLDGIKLYQFPYVNPWNWMYSDWWLNEFTYEELGDWGRILKNTNKMKKSDITLKNSSGLWIEKFPAIEYLENLKSITKSPANDGYWIYSHMRLSKNSYWRLHPDDPHTIETLKSLPYQSFIDEEYPQFFEELKNLNGRIEKYRSGLMFNILSFLYSFFR